MKDTMRCIDCGHYITNQNTSSNQNINRLCGKCYLKRKVKMRIQKGLV